MKLDALIKEKERRQALPNLLEACFDKQIAFLNDKSRRKALFVARRSGKTWAIAVALIQACLESPATKCLYYGLTAQVAWDTIYLHMIEVLARQFHINIKTNSTQKTITFDNQSYIKITGDDANEKQIDKALGGKYKLVIFDECQSINHDLENWIKAKIGPAMVDLKGTIVLAGTAGDLMGERYWYKVTKTEGERLPGWNVHSWDKFDNPHMAELVRAELEHEKSLDKNYEESDSFKQQWLCQWVTNTSGRIYKYSTEKNALKDEALIKSLTSFDKKWKYIFGMDFGFEDDTALVVGAFWAHDNRFYIVDSFKKPKMLTSEIANQIKEWKDLYKPIQIVGDCQNKTLIEDLRQTYRIPIVPAKKLGKAAHWAEMNNDFQTGKIQVIEANNRALIKEWDELTYKEKQRLLGVYEENPSKDNHLADACLYMYHFSKHYNATPEPVITQQEYRMRHAEESLKRQLNYNQDSWEPQGDLRDYIDNMEYVQQYKKDIR